MKELNESTLRNESIIAELSKTLRETSNELIVNPNLYLDVREMGLDSIAFIQFIATVEEKFQFEFGYDEIEKLQPASIIEISKYILALKR